MTEPAVESQLRPQRRVGRFEVFTEIAAGGMATVHLGRLTGASDFARIVAIKRLHPQYAKSPEFVEQFLDEARLVARIRHPNVIPTLDLIEEAGELFIVMEFVEGESLVNLMRAARKRGERVPLRVGLRVLSGALHGLHAAHEATNEHGESMGVVHRDVSPDNILVGTDGFPRVLDFGIARALGAHVKTEQGVVKGKLAYMSPEQVLGDPVTRATDVFAASAVLWQVLTHKRLFKGKHVGEYTHKILNQTIRRPSDLLDELPKKLDPIVLRGLKRDPAERWGSAQRMAEALEAVGDLATQREVGQWVERIAQPQLRALMDQVKAVERAPRAAHSPPSEALREGLSDETAAPTPSAAPSDADAEPRMPLESGISVRDEPYVPGLDRVSAEYGDGRKASGRTLLLVGGVSVIVLVSLVIIWIAAGASPESDWDGDATPTAMTTDLPTETAPPDPSSEHSENRTETASAGIVDPTPPVPEPDEAQAISDGGSPSSDGGVDGGAGAPSPSATARAAATPRPANTGTRTRRPGIYSRH